MLNFQEILDYIEEHLKSEIVPFSDIEKKAIPLVILAIQLTCVAYFIGYEKFSELAKTNITMTNWLLDNYDKLIWHES